VHRFAHGVVSAKRKRNVTDAAAHSRGGQIFFDPTRRFQEIDGIIAVLLQASCHGKNVGIENDVAGGEIEAMPQ